MNREDAEKKIIELAQWRCTTKLCEGRISCHKCKEDRLTEVMKIIEALQERPKGRWIEEWRSELDTYSGEYWEESYYKCSLCGRFECVKENYCPSCGADNRGEE